jgi:hypothetical protein
MEREAKSLLHLVPKMGRIAAVWQLFPIVFLVVMEQQIQIVIMS